MKHKSWLLAGSALGLLLAARPVAAQDAADAAAQPKSGIEDVTVTAERRTSNVQKTAISVAVRNGDDLVKQGKTTLQQILEDVPGVTVNAPTTGDNPGLAIVIRGVAPDAVPTGDTSVAATGLYVDGVNSGIGGDYDIDRVEVLRGPQGTLYGRSATGGVVSTTTRDPQIGKFNAYINAEYGSYDLRHLTVAANLPVASQFAVRLAANEYDQLGYVSMRGGSQAHTEARVKLLYQPSSDLSLLLGWAIQEDHGHTGGYAGAVDATDPNKIDYSSAPIYPSEDHYRQYWARLNWNLGFGNLTYIPTFHNFTTHSDSAIVNPFFQQALTNENPLDQITTQEVRLASEEGSPLTWIVGSYYYNRLYKDDASTTWEPQNALTYAQDIDKSTTNVGVFGEATYPFANSWKATAGLRWDYTRIRDDLNYLNNDTTSCGDNSPTCSPSDPTFGLPVKLQDLVVSGPAGISSADNVTYKFRIEDDFTAQNLAYVMVSSGFLPGDLAVSPNGTPLQAEVFHYKPETLTAFEAGSKNRFLGNRLQINGDVYYYDYSGYQQFVNTSHTPAPAISVITSPARMFGLELESVWRVTPTDRLTASLGYTNAHYHDKPADFAPFVAQSAIPGIAPLTLQGDYDHDFNFADGSAVTLHADVHYTSGYDEGAISTSETQYESWVHVNGQPIGDVSLGWNSASQLYAVTGYIRNVANDIYKTGTYLPFAGSGVTTPSAPRIYGVVLHAAY